MGPGVRQCERARCHEKKGIRAEKRSGDGGVDTYRARCRPGVIEGHGHRGQNMVTGSQGSFACFHITCTCRVCTVGLPLQLPPASYLVPALARPCPPSRCSCSRSSLTVQTHPCYELHCCFAPYKLSSRASSKLCAQLRHPLLSIVFFDRGLSLPL